MRDDEIRRLLTAANPWWRAAAARGDRTAWAKENRLLLDRDRLDLGFRSGCLDDIASGPITDQLVVLTGPRRIGKSVTLLNTARTLCSREDLDPRQVIHLPCDDMKDRDLRRALTLARELTRAVDLAGAVPRVWLLDEVSGVPGWSTVLKAARDGTGFGDDTVVATGSRWSATEDIDGNLMAGRAGRGEGRRKRVIHPMSFREYLSCARPALARISSVRPDQLQSREARESLAGVAFDVDEYDLAWQGYLTCGGFPRAVAEHTRDSIVSTAYVRDLAAWLRRDIDADAPPDSIPLLLNEVTVRSTSPLNVAATASHLGYSSRKVFDVRLHRLVSTHAALWCHRRDDDQPVPGSQSKLYLTDPILGWLPNRIRAGLPEPDMTRLTEMTIGVALARAVDALDEGRWISGDSIYFTRTASDNEIDLAPVPIPTDDAVERSVPLESKWVDQGWRKEARTIEGKYGAGILATKSILDTDSSPTWAVPAPLLALLLG